MGDWDEALLSMKRLALGFAAMVVDVALCADARAQDAAPVAPALPSESPQEAPAPRPSQMAPDATTRAVAEPPLAGFHNGLFYLRDQKDIFRLYVQGRVHVDGIMWRGPGVTSLEADSALKTSLQLRRVRAELAGEFFQDWQWQTSIDLAPTTNDNPA